jgi:hypothetical protein
MMECMEAELNSLRIILHIPTLLINVINFVKKMEAAKDSHLVEFQLCQLMVQQEVDNAHSITMEFVQNLLLQLLTLTTMLRLHILSNLIGTHSDALTFMNGKRMLFKLRHVKRKAS